MIQLPSIPPDVSFNASIELTQQLLHHLCASASVGDVSVGDAAVTNADAMQEQAAEEQAIAQAVSALVQSKPGARGFFVAYLTGDQPPPSPPHPAVVTGLKRAPEQTTDLLTKNLAMSTAMALTHRRQGSDAMAQQSAQVRSRTLDLIEALQMPALAQSLMALRDSAASADGTFEAFLTRWGYDEEQRQHIKASADEALGRLG